jgi:predicted DNA-binding transcriptional regulator YafY
VSERAVSPQRLVHYRATWYLDAWCHTRERLLRFALDAIEHAEALDTKAKELPLKQVEAEMDRGYGIYAGAEPSWVTLAFGAQAAQWVSREEWHPDQRGQWLPDGRYQLEVPYTDPNELAMDILRHADEVEVIADTGTVKAAVRERTQKAWALHCVGKTEA